MLLHLHEDFRNKALSEHADFLRDKAFLEFGVYSGGSILGWYNAYQRHGVKSRFFGFDSFTGLPPETEDPNTIWHAGQFSMSGHVPDMIANHPGIQLVKGYYADSLTEEVATRLGDTKIGIVHFDCDTYGSTKTVWEWLLKYDLLAVGAIVIYDDWGASLQAGCDEFDVGEARAHREIESKHGLKFEHYDKYIIDPAFYVVQSFRYLGKQ